MELKEIERLAEREYPNTVKWRRHFHMYPELSFQEVQTPGFIAQFLRELRMVHDLASKASKVTDVQLLSPELGGEDFSYYLQRVKGTFFNTGVRNPNFKADYPHHHSKLDIDEHGMINAVSLLIGAVYNYCEEVEHES